MDFYPFHLSTKPIIPVLAHHPSRMSHHLFMYLPYSVSLLHIVRLPNPLIPRRYRPPPNPTPSLPLLDTLQNRTSQPTLTNLTPPQILKPRSQRPINIMILPRKPPLAPIIQLIELIAPMASEPEPTCRGRRIARCWLESFSSLGEREIGCGFEKGSSVLIVRWCGVEVIGVIIQRWVPEWSFICYIGEEAEGQDVRVFPGHGVHGMTPKRGIKHRTSFSTRSLAFLYSIVGISRAARMSGEEYGFGDAVVEADQRVLPVADVVSETNVEDCGPEIVAVEVEPEGVEDAMAFVDHY